MRQHLASGHSAARCLAGIFLALICLLPASCTDSRDTITVGSKNFGESNVLAQMFAILIRERGIPVAGPIEYPSTQSVLEALKRGDIDIYPRSEERRVGKECVSTCRSRWSPYH